MSNATKINPLKLSAQIQPFSCLFRPGLVGINYFLFYLFWGLLLPWTDVVIMRTNEIVAREESITLLIEAIFGEFWIEKTNSTITKNVFFLCKIIKDKLATALFVFLGLTL